MKILVIDDDNFARTVYESEFHQQNLEVVLAADGADGIAKAIKEKPDLIVSELILTRKNGFQVLEELKKEKNCKNIPVVICSSLGQKTDIDEAIKLGAVKYFSKEDYSIKQVVKGIIDILMSE